MPPISLARATYGFVALTFILLSGLALLLLTSRSQELVDEALDTAVRIRTEAAAETIARTLHADWRDLEFLAQTIEVGDRDETLAVMSGLRGEGDRIKWVGYADTSGTVRIASEGMLEGQDVASRPWFRAGLQDGYAGDLHEAVLLSRLLPEAPDGEPLRFVDLALPVRGADGDVTGVLGMHIDAAWVESVLTETAGTLGLDVFLVAADGTVMLGSAGVPGEAGELRVFQSARAGVESAGRETWPDGRDYFSALVPSVGYDDLPSFGWRMIGRLDAATFQPTLASVRSTTVLVALGGVALLAGLTVLFVAFYIRPIRALAEVAGRLADGIDEYPPERGNTREAALISSSLVRLSRAGGATVSEDGT